MKRSKWFLTGMTMLLLCSSLAFAEYKDVKGHWAENAIHNAIQNKILVGHNGKFDPKGNITKSQMASMLSKMLNYQSVTEISYSDVKEGQWYHDPIAKLSAKNLVTETGSYMPKHEMSRKEVFVLLAKALYMSTENISVLDKFADAKNLLPEEKKYIAALVESGYLVGNKNNLNLNSKINRAEFAAIMDRMVVRYVDEPTTITGNVQGNIVVRSKNVVFEKAQVNGKIILADGIEEKDVKFTDTKSSGILYITKGEQITDDKTPLASLPTVGGGGSSSSNLGGSGGNPNTGNNAGNSGGQNPGGGSNSGGNSNNPNPGQQTNILESVLDLEKTKVIDLGYAQYLTIVFKEGNVLNYEIFVDGEKISTRPVNDEQTIVKWEIKKLDHKELRIIRSSDKQEGTYDLLTKTIVK